jgi:hypothetical protein
MMSAAHQGQNRKIVWTDLKLIIILKKRKEEKKKKNIYIYI